MIPAAIKSFLKRTPLYVHYFARQNALSLDTLSAEEMRFKALYATLLPNRGSLVFDIGANLGARVKVFLGLGSRVVAVEPQRICSVTLRRTFGDRVTIVEAAVSDKVGKANLKACGVHAVATLTEEWIERTTNSGRFIGLKWDKTDVVRTTTLDALINTFGIPEFIKIDVEGYELFVLRGLSFPVNVLSFEFHAELADMASDCVDRLQSLGMYEYNFSVGDTAELHFSKWRSAKSVKVFLQQEQRRGDVYARITEGQFQHLKLSASRL
jgi:FkbM family methyltransferase